MNMIKTTVLVSSLLSAFSYADATSFREALTQGKTSGAIRNTLELSSSTDARAEGGAFQNSKSGMSALELKYVTQQYNGLSFGAVFQAGWDWGIQDESTGLTIQGGEDDHRITISSANLQNLYVDYSFAAQGTNTSIRYGRQDIISPLIMRSGLQPMKDAWQGVVVTNTDIDKTVIKAMYITDWIMRYQDDASASITQNDKHYDDPILSLYVNTKAVDGLNIEAQWLDYQQEGAVGDAPSNVGVAGPFTTTFLAADYDIPGTSFSVGAKYNGADFDNSEDSSMWGVHGSTLVGPVKVTLSYVSVDDKANMPGTLGHVPLFRSYNNTITDTEFWAGVDSTSVNLGYDFGVKGLAANLNITSMSQSDEGIANGGVNFDGAYEVSIDAKYKVASVDGLSLRLMLAQASYDSGTYADNDMTYSRIFVDYAF